MKYRTHPEGPSSYGTQEVARGMSAIFHEGCFPSLLSMGNGVILRGFLYSEGYFTCICRIELELFPLLKHKLV